MLHRFSKHLGLGRNRLSKKKLNDFSHELLALEIVVESLEKKHLRSKEKLMSVLKPLLGHEEHGDDLHLLLKYSGMGWAGLNSSMGQGFGKHNPNSSFPQELGDASHHMKDTAAILEDTGFAIQTVNDRLEDLSKRQDELESFLVMLAGFVDRKRNGVWDDVTTVSTLSGTLYSNVPDALDSIWSEAWTFWLTSFFAPTCKCGEDDIDNNHTVKKSQSNEEALSEALILALQSIHKSLQHQMTECDGLLQTARDWKKKQDKFRQALSLPPDEIAIIVENSDILLKNVSEAAHNDDDATTQVAILQYLDDLTFV